MPKCLILSNLTIFYSTFSSRSLPHSWFVMYIRIYVADIDIHLTYFYYLITLKIATFCSVCLGLIRSKNTLFCTKFMFFINL